MKAEESNDPYGSEPIYERIYRERLQGDDYNDQLEDPEGGASENITAAFELIADVFANGTVAELDKENVLYRLVDAFNRPLSRLSLDHTEACSALRDLITQDDASEVITVRIEQAQRRAHLLEKRADHLALMRDAAARRYGELLGSQWRAPNGSVPSKVTSETASARNARQYLAGTKARELAALAPEGPLIAIAGPQEYKNLNNVEKLLDSAYRNHPDMVLVHGGDPKNRIDNTGAEWARANDVEQIIMERPNHQRYGAAAPFKRNDDMIKLGLTGVILFTRGENEKPHGISMNVGQKAAEQKPPIPVKIVTP